MAPKFFNPPVSWSDRRRKCPTKSTLCVRIFFPTGISDTVSHRLLIQAGSNTTMITRHHPHHFPTESLEHLNLSLELPTYCQKLTSSTYSAVVTNLITLLADIFMPASLSMYKQVCCAYLVTDNTKAN
jgi:hypothetical protein